MTAALMGYSLLVAVLVAGAARGFETVARAVGLPLRWVWATSIAALMLLVLIAQIRSVEPPPVSPQQPRSATSFVDGISPGYPVEVPAVSSSPGEERPSPAASLTGWLAALARLSSRVVDRTLTFVWLASTALALCIIGATHARLRWRRRRWPIAVLHGQQVRIAADFGPAVIGIGSGEIVIPQSLLQLPAPQSLLIVAHEAEHVRARDSLLLFLAWTSVAILAWNPIVWWMISRLRLAVEIDCDSRTLRRGVDRGIYGTVLVQVAQRYAVEKFATVALTSPRSHLERRLLAMISPAERPPTARTISVALLAGIAILAACGVRMPTVEEARTAEDVNAIGDSQVPSAESRAGAPQNSRATVAADPRDAGSRGTLTDRAAAAAGTAEENEPDAGGSMPEFSGLAAIENFEPAVVDATRPPPNPFGLPPAPGIGRGEVFAAGYGTRTIVYLVDGVRSDIQDNAPVAPGHPMYGLNGDDVEVLAVLMCEQATRIIPEAIHGLVVVRTRNGADDGIQLPPSRHLRGVNSGTLRPANCGDSLSRGSIDAALTGMGMLIVDGVRASRQEALTIPASAISSVSLPQRSVTAAQLVEHYGRDAANGVAVVTTRGGDWRPAVGVAQ